MRLGMFRIKRKKYIKHTVSAVAAAVCHMATPPPPQVVPPQK